MIRVVLDFETYYDREYSLRRMSQYEYVSDPRFRLLLAAVFVEHRGHTERVMLKPFQWETFVQRMPWRLCEVVAHNLMFDGLILARYGVRPARWTCTMQLAHREVLPYTGSVALDACARFFGLDAKLEGLREGLEEADGQLEVYAARDVDLAAELVDRMPSTETEAAMVDWTIDVAVRPRLVLDVELLDRRLDEEERQDAELLKRLGVTVRELRSPLLFAELLRRHGVEPATKPGARGETYAFAKTDPFMQELMDHPDPAVQALVRARLRMKGRQEVDRAKALRRLAAACDGRLPVPLHYHRARTGRWTGALINLQNLKRGSWVRQAVCAPPGHRLVVADLAQIEARLTAALAGEQALLASFEGGDPYADFASRLFGFPVTKADHPRERQVGKVAVLGLGYGCGAGTFWDRMLRFCGIEGADIEMARRVVEVYRRTYPAIPRLWYRLDELLPVMAAGGKAEVALPAATLQVDGPSIVLPSGRRIVYPGLRRDEHGEWICDVPTRRQAPTMRLWGGVLTENVVQAIARDVLTEAHARLLRDGIDVVLQVHDELVAVVPADAAADAARHMEAVLTTPPEWLRGVPLAAEVVVAERYGDAK